MLSKIFYCFLILIVFCTSAYGQKIQYIIIDKAHKTIPVAVPAFKIMNGHAEEALAAEKAKTILIKALDFTGYLQVMNPLAYLADPSKTGIRRSDINFRDWTGIAAEFLITAGISENNGRIEMELRCFDTFQSAMLVGKSYSGSDSQIRQMIHLFCGEVFYVLTGKRGVFNTELTFVSTVNRDKEIFSCDFDGRNVRQLTSHNSLSLSPVRSSDGKWLAYVSYAKGKPDLYIKNMDTKQGAIVNKKGMNISPAWMPGQAKLAASLSFSGDTEIYLLSIKGKVIKKLTDTWNIDVSPSFSPDGTKIAFTSRRGGTAQIYIKNIESGDIRRLTFIGMNNTSPAWSPDGNKIAYVSLANGRMNIYVMDINSAREPVQLTSDSGDNEDPAWSPDGSMLAFTSTREQGLPKIFIMNASGAGQRRLVSMKGKQSQPNWANQWTEK